MGFSLKRALAGAVVGAGNAISELADLQLKEEAAARLRAQEMLDRSQLQREESDLITQRQQRELEAKSKMVDDERTKIGAIVKEAKTGYKGKDINSSAGMRYTAGKLTEMGRIDLANILEDNARAADATANQHADRQASLANAQLNHRDNQENIRQRRSEEQSTKELARMGMAEQRLFKQVETLSNRIGTTGRDGKFNKDEDAFAVGNDIANRAVQNGMSYTDAAEQAHLAMRRFNSGRAEAAKLGKVFNPDSVANQLIGGFESQLLDKKNESGTAQFNNSGKRFAPDPTIKSGGILSQGVQPTTW